MYPILVLSNPATCLLRPLHLSNYSEHPSTVGDLGLRVEGHGLMLLEV